MRIISCRPKEYGERQQITSGSKFERHQVWATYEHFQDLLIIREPADEDLQILLNSFRKTLTQTYSKKGALTQSQFRKLIQPLIRTGHIVQDFCGG